MSFNKAYLTEIFSTFMMPGRTGLLRCLTRLTQTTPLPGMEFVALQSSSPLLLKLARKTHDVSFLLPNPKRASVHC